MSTGDLISIGSAALFAVSGSTVLAQLVGWLVRRGRDRSEQESIIVGAANQVVEMLRAELRDQEQRHRMELTAQENRHREEMDRLHHELDDARGEISKLKRDLAAAGGAT